MHADAAVLYTSQKSSWCGYSWLLNLRGCLEALEAGPNLIIVLFAVFTFTYTSSVLTCGDFLGTYLRGMRSIFGKFRLIDYGNFLRIYSRIGR